MLAHSISGDQLEFERMLTTLDHQWQSLIKRTHEKKSVIETKLACWHTYRTQSQNLEDKLIDMTNLLKEFDFSTVSIQRMKTLLNNIKV